MNAMMKKAGVLAVMTVCGFVAAPAVVMATTVPITATSVSSPPNTLSFSSNSYLGYGGLTPFETQTLTQTYTGGSNPDSYTITQSVYHDPTPGVLDLVYTITLNSPPTTTTLSGVTLNGFGFSGLTYAFVNSPVADMSVYENAFGNIVFNFNPISSGALTVGIQVTALGVVPDANVSTSEGGTSNSPPPGFWTPSNDTTAPNFVSSPEPSSMVIGAMMGLCCVGRAGWSRWRKKAKVEAAPAV